MVKCYCAFCRNPRLVFRQKSLSFTNVFQCALISSALTFGFWGTVDPKGLIIFISLLMVMESVILVKRRFGVECQQCGFDPYLYMRNQKMACDKVIDHMAKRVDDPNVWLARRPPIRLPKRKHKGRSTQEFIA